MKIDAKSLPALPFGMNPTYTFFDGKYIHLVCMDEHSVFDYSWDGASADYQTVSVSLRVTLI